MRTPHSHLSLRRQIIFGTRIFTFVTTLTVSLALFCLSNQYVLSSNLQSAEFNLRLVSSSIEVSLESADQLLNWAGTSSSIRRYLSWNGTSGAQLISAFNAAQEKYRSSTLQPKIQRFFLTNARDQYLQFGVALNSSSALNESSVEKYLQYGYGMHITEDPLLPKHAKSLSILRPLRTGKSTADPCYAYLGLDLSVITAPAAEYAMLEDSTLYWEMNGMLWQYSGGTLHACENFLEDADYTKRSGHQQHAMQQSAWQSRITLNGRHYYAVRVSLDNRDAALIQLLPEETFLQARNLYLGFILLGFVFIWALSLVLQQWLTRVITRPVEALQQRIAAIGRGDFTVDHTLEWDNELGDIGRGINQLAADVGELMAHRIEDERKKQELEYQMLQNEVNPHFIYNTLNSIRWMATLQHAPGIEEMVTAFARLTKSISKGTEKLVSLRYELSLLQDYFTIQKYRYGGDIEIEMEEIADERLYTDCLIPRFTLQPIVENSIFHGLEPKGGHGTIQLSVCTDADGHAILIHITDDGVGMPPETAVHLLDAPESEQKKNAQFRHVGLWNVQRRIQYSFGTDYGLTIESEPNVGTEVTIRLPDQKKGGANAADITGR